jgi:hypothetical protein
LFLAVVAVVVLGDGVVWGNGQSSSTMMVLIFCYHDIPPSAIHSTMTNQ